MRVLIAEDDPVSRRLLESHLRRFGYEVETAADGLEAWRALAAESAPRMAILDWMMPELDGVEVCRRVRRSVTTSYVYLLLLTAKNQKDDIVAGLDAGADDYLTKPFHPQELRSRLRVGERILQLESSLAEKVAALQDALAEVRELQGLIPICMHCRKVRNESDVWEQLERYTTEHWGARFSHSVCQNCLEEHHPELQRRKV